MLSFSIGVMLSQQCGLIENHIDKHCEKDVHKSASSAMLVGLASGDWGEAQETRTLSLYLSLIQTKSPKG